MLDQVGGRLRHAPSEAQRTQPAFFVDQGDDLGLWAALAHQQRGAEAEYAAIEELLKLRPDEVRQRRRGEVVLYGLVEGLDVVTNNLVEGAALDPAAPVAVARPARRGGSRRSRRGSSGRDVEHGARRRREQAKPPASANRSAATYAAKECSCQSCPTALLARDTRSRIQHRHSTLP